MNSHGNARTTPFSRTLIVERRRKGNRNARADNAASFQLAVEINFDLL